MIIEVETVGIRSEISDHIDAYDIHDAVAEYEFHGSEYENETQYVKADSLSKLIDHIGSSCIVKHPSKDTRRMDDATWVVRVYDGYNE